MGETFGAGSSSGTLTGDTTHAETMLMVTDDGSGDTSTSTSSSGSTGLSDSSTTAADDQGSSLLLYTRELESGAWSSVDLDDVWTGASAPPTDGILGAVSLTHFNRFIVFSDDGYTYQKMEGAWIEPVLTDDLFPVIGTRGIEAVSHRASHFDPLGETLVIRAGAHDILYQIYENGNVDFVQDLQLMDDLGGGPLQATWQLAWAFTRTNLAEPGEDWVQLYELYTNNVSYSFYSKNGSGVWLSLPPLNNEFFTMGTLGEPNPLQAVATWYDDDTRRLNVIAP